MKRYVHVFLSILFIHTPLNSIPLAQQFCVLSTKTERVCPTTVAPTNGYYLIFVPDGTQDPRHDLLAFTHQNTLTVPIGFFGLNNPSQKQTPTFLYFSWEKKSPSIQNNAFATHALKLSAGIAQLSAKNHCIIITQGLGGLLVNKASQINKWNSQNVTVVQIATPIPQQDKNNTYAPYLPDLNNIHTLYSLYSDYPFPISTLSHKAQATYNKQQLMHGIAYQIQIFINNKVPKQTDLFSPIIGKKLFEIISNTRKKYHLQRSLSAYISSKNQNVFITIKNSTPAPSKDNLKKRWAVESQHSKEQKDNFKQIYDTTPATGFSPREKMRAKYKV